LIAGAVLAGGKSLRFGRNKAFEKLGGKRLIDLAVESLRPFCDPVMIVANDIEPYLDIAVMMARDVVPNLGPLGGIYTALLFSPVEWVFVKATDMPFLVSELASVIIEAREGYEAVVPTVGGFEEPLLALYNRACLSEIARQLKESDRHRAKDFYRKIRIRTLSEAEWRRVDPAGLSFKNVNTLSDLAEIDGLERS
jgi:molybdopterin-guanine dinucleotide biosynthesis protein A